MASVQSPLGQVFKLPILVQHYLKHQQQEGMSLLGFVNEHYASTHTDEDQQEDQQLPFKAIVSCNLGFATITSSYIADFSLTFSPEKKQALLQAYTPQQHLNNIFHPPRL